MSRGIRQNAPRIIEEIIAKYAVDANLFWLGSTNPKNRIWPLLFFFGLLYRGLIIGRLLSGAYYREAIVRGLLSGGYCPGGFCPEAFDLDLLSRGIVRPWQRSPLQKAKKTALAKLHYITRDGQNVVASFSTLTFRLPARQHIFWNFVYGQILFRGTNNSWDRGVEIPFGLGLISFWNLLFLLLEFVFFLSSTQPLVHNSTCLSDRYCDRSEVSVSERAEQDIPH